MKPITKAVVVALIQIALVSSLGAKLLYDRHSRPCTWFRAVPYDPNLPIRGRYVRLQIQVNDPRSREELERMLAGTTANELSPAKGIRNTRFGWECGSIEVRDGISTAVFDRSPSSSAIYDCSKLSFFRRKTGDEITLALSVPVLFFIPDTARDPTRLATGEELWVLATIPRKGPPRPVALGIKNVGETTIRPLSLN